MSKRCPKTNGIDWLCLSLASFNGSGYADKTTPETYIASYLAFKKWKKELEAISLVNEYMEYSLEQAERLCMARDPSHTPNDKKKAEFNQHYDPNKVWELFQ